jgi:hypothetical protein
LQTLAGLGKSSEMIQDELKLAQQQARPVASLIDAQLLGVNNLYKQSAAMQSTRF